MFQPKTFNDNKFNFDQDFDDSFTPIEDDDHRKQDNLSNGMDDSAIFTQLAFYRAGTTEAMSIDVNTSIDANMNMNFDANMNPDSSTSRDSSPNDDDGEFVASVQRNLLDTASQNQPSTALQTPSSKSTSSSPKPPSHPPKASGRLAVEECDSHAAATRKASKSLAIGAIDSPNARKARGRNLRRARASSQGSFVGLG